jgi:hypothetical protein
MEVTACIITRGDLDMTPIIETIPSDWELSVWDPARRPDEGVWGRYVLVADAKTPLVYLQDDDVIFRGQRALLHQWRATPDLMLCNWPHGTTGPRCFDDCGLMHAGAIVKRDSMLRGVEAYLEHWPHDLDFSRDCDMAAGVLTPHRYTLMPHELRPAVHNPNRMSHQPWQRETKMRVYNRSVAIRDHVLGPSRTDTMPVR